MSDYPLVSVLIVHYNRPHILEKALQSFKDHCSYPNLEFVITDDNSKPEVIEEIKKLPFDKYVFAEKNGGIGANANKGIKACSGKYILQIQDDHLVMPGFNDYLQHGVTVLESNKKVGFLRYIVGRHFKVKHAEKIDATEYYVVPKAIWKNGERGFFQYSDLPHLKPADIHERIGYYLENKPMAYTENEFNIRFLRTKGVQIGFVKGYENIFDTYEAESYRADDLQKRNKKTLKNALKNLLKRRVGIIRLTRFYYWVMKYDYKNRRL